MLLVSGCATDPAKLELAELDGYLSEGSVVPGRSYLFSLEATTTGGDRVDNIDHAKLVISSPGNGFRVQEQDRYGVRVRVTQNSFDLMRRRGLRRGNEDIR
jgi:hypothetical protein